MAEVIVVKQSSFKRTALELASGVALGFIIATLGGPGLVKLLYEPPSKDAFSCAGSVEKALGEFIKLQLTFAALGGIGLWLLMFLVRRTLRKRREVASV